MKARQIIEADSGEDFPRRAYYQKAIEGLSEFQRLFLALDVAVTGVRPELAVSQYHHFPKSFEDWLTKEGGGGNPLLYLADGGYSRVVFSTETGNLFLTDNSTSRAKANWEKAFAERKAFQEHCQAEYRRLLGQTKLESRAKSFFKRASRPYSDEALRTEFINYLQNQLIPDLKDSGQDAAAEEFETGVRLLQQEPTQAAFQDADVRGWVAWLQDTWVPDLRASGTHATADDVDTLIRFIAGRGYWVLPQGHDRYPNRIKFRDEE